MSPKRYRESGIPVVRVFVFNELVSKREKNFYSRQVRPAALCKQHIATPSRQIPLPHPPTLNLPPANTSIPVPPNPNTAPTKTPRDGGTHVKWLDCRVVACRRWSELPGTANQVKQSGRPNHRRVNCKILEFEFRIRFTLKNSNELLTRRLILRY